MPALAPDKPIKQSVVDMAQIVLLNKDEVAKTVLGSCIGLAIHDPDRKLTAVAHIVLSEASSREGPPGKFADTAIPFMLKELTDRGSRCVNLVAKMAGGSNMFGSKGPIQIGSSNANAVRAILASKKIPVLAEHIGGSKGRRVTVDGATFTISIDIPGEVTAVI